jgi:hypothetical protein
MSRIRNTGTVNKTRSVVQVLSTDTVPFDEHEMEQSRAQSFAYFKAACSVLTAEPPIYVYTKNATEWSEKYVQNVM